MYDSRRRLSFVHLNLSTFGDGDLHHHDNYSMMTQMKGQEPVLDIFNYNQGSVTIPGSIMPPLTVSVHNVSETCLTLKTRLKASLRRLPFASRSISWRMFS